MIFAVPIDPGPRHHCAKCTKKLAFAEENYCRICRRLLGMSTEPLSRTDLANLGLLPPMGVRSRLEPIPNVKYVEEWPEVDEAGERKVLQELLDAGKMGSIADYFN